MNSTPATIENEPALRSRERPRRQTAGLMDTVRNAVLRRVRKAVFGVLDLHTEFEVLD